MSVETKKAFRILLTMHNKYKFFLIGLMEPFQQAYKLESYRRRLGLEFLMSNVSGKIWAVVSDEFEVDVLIDSVQQITLRLSNWHIGMEMTVTLVYAKCDRIERIELWDSLYNLASNMNTPWLVGGDFNVIADEHEKYGGQPVSLNEVEDFRHCINTCNLTDLGYKGSVYTWWNGRGTGDCIFKRLDICLSNFEFQQLFPGLEITHLIKNGSDHSPLLLEYKEEVVQIRKSLRFLNFWVKHETFLDVVRANWNTDVPANSFMSFNLKLKKVLSQWSRAIYGDIIQQVTNLKEVIKAHEQQFEADPSLLNREKLQKVQAELIKVYALEEEYWKQKASLQWFQECDKNSKFFDAHVNGKRKFLQLRRIQDSQGTWLETDEEIAEDAVRFYHAQFHETNVPTQFDILQQVPRMITPK
ncbi:uncharacterized protein LOC132613112 [Lycium barbarum]|uniref:uncharacterized protein LOC132613112 n=1 Tax=Lycium barbarum TaxID=112863 RepID=UPI00293ED976|nr:uncharacterized protein LOC132613112 [Lycium barbarum]